IDRQREQHDADDDREQHVSHHGSHPSPPARAALRCTGASWTAVLVCFAGATFFRGRPRRGRWPLPMNSRTARASYRIRRRATTSHGSGGRSRSRLFFRQLANVLMLKRVACAVSNSVNSAVGASWARSNGNGASGSPLNPCLLRGGLVGSAAAFAIRCSTLL